MYSFINLMGFNMDLMGIKYMTTYMVIKKWISISFDICCPGLLTASMEPFE